MAKEQRTVIDAEVWTGRFDDRIDPYEPPSAFEWKPGWRAVSIFKLILAGLLFGCMLLITAGGWMSVLKTLITNQPLPDWEQFRGLATVSLTFGLCAWFFTRMLWQTNRARQLTGERIGASPALTISEDGVCFAGAKSWSLRWSEATSVLPRLPAMAFISNLQRVFVRPRIVELVAPGKPEGRFMIPVMAIDVDSVRLLLTIERKIWGPSRAPAKVDWMQPGEVYRISGRPLDL